MYCVLLVSYMLMAADRYLFPVLAPDIRKAFGFSLANTGLLSTIFTLGLGLGGLPTGYLLARYSRKMVLLTGIVIFSAATALTTVVPGFWTMLVCLAAQGIGMSMLATSMFALAASYFSGYRVRGHRLRQFLLRHRRISRPVPRRKTSSVLRLLARADDLVRRVWFRDGGAHRRHACAPGSAKRAAPPKSKRIAAVPRASRTAIP